VDREILQGPSVGINKQVCTVVRYISRIAMFAPMKTVIGVPKFEKGSTSLYGGILCTYNI
jgi:hypothetical protein